jgi:hypothetical protein
MSFQNFEISLPHLVKQPWDLSSIIVIQFLKCFPKTFGLILSRNLHTCPFESLMVQSYYQLGASLVDNLHEQVFTSFLINVLSNRYKHVSIRVWVQWQALDY